MLLFCGTLEEKFPAIIDWFGLKGVSVVSECAEPDPEYILKYDACIIEATPGKLMSQCGFPEQNFDRRQAVGVTHRYWAIALELQPGTTGVITQRTVRDGIVVDRGMVWPMSEPLRGDYCGVFLTPHNNEAYLVGKHDYTEQGRLLFEYELYISERRYYQVRCN